MRKFSELKIGWSDEDGGYVATCPEYPRLFAIGDTPETAFAEALRLVDVFRNLKALEKRRTRRGKKKKQDPVDK